MLILKGMFNTLRNVRTKRNLNIKEILNFRIKRINSNNNKN
jgi:hypothetical protein